MNEITEKIRLALGQELLPEPSDNRYQCFNTGSTEVEIGEFLFAFVRMMKSFRILETGTFKGVSSSYMGLALKENNYGLLNTIEYDETHFKESQELFEKLDITPWVEGHQGLVENFSPDDIYDLMFLDTEVNLRLHEMVKFFSYLRPGGYVFIHDMPFTLCQGNVNSDHLDFKHWPIGEIPQRLTDLVKEGKLRPMFFPNPRGMLAFYKPRIDEHKWI